MYRFLVLGCLLAVWQVEAKVITVNNREGATADHSTMAGALDAAENGDVIYVSGSPILYDDFTIRKKVVLIGTGHNPSGAGGLVSQLNKVVLDMGSSGTEIIGFSINLIDIGIVSEIEDVKISRNYLINNTLYLSSLAKRWFIEENIIGNIFKFIDPTDLSLEQKHVIRNNIITGVVNNIFFSDFINNVFTYPVVGAFESVRNCQFLNNIFFQNDLSADFDLPRITFSSFLNNIFYGPSNPNSLPMEHGIEGEGNIFANPQFVNVQENSFRYTFDYSLQPSSPGVNAGTDGTDIGIFGGIGFSITGEPDDLPVVTRFDILNPMVPQNGSLRVRIEGRAN
ncbi:hypothetical protein ADIS_0512 [Lunatimonas lonarensis]|uniref:Cell surface protein n=2 Tax=Lunatimonas lonarensis TaxID=1232681 RepID=R7ZY36_9BACT|nr:hypothetical protein ADIS_0512 [Lunatimonas lonarensis]